MASKTKKIKSLQNGKVSKKYDSINLLKSCPEYLTLHEQYSELMFNYKILLKENDQLRRKIALVNTQHHTANEKVSKSIQTESKVKANTKINTDVQPESIVSQVFTTIDNQNDSFNKQCNIEHIEGPCMLFPGHPFSTFRVELLDNEMDYSHKLESRQLKYFGEHPYKYGNIAHQPCSIPENSYISKITDHISQVCPNYKFNSILVTKFESGKSFLPMHSDNEDVIHPDSVILTVSLGAARTIKFQLKDTVSSPECSVKVSHGDVYAMTCKSQSTYKHGIPKDYSKDARISLTFRLITPNTNCNTSLDSIGQFLCDLNTSQVCTDTLVTVVPNELPESSNIPVTHYSSAPESSGNNEKAVPYSDCDTLYVSSSMFRELSEEKLTTPEHPSTVLYFPGATASGIHRKLQESNLLKSVNPTKIKQVFLLCGTNDIDSILGVKRSDYNNLINNNTHALDVNKLQRAMNDMEQLLDYLHHTFKSANLKVINVLPRASRLRNEVINKINSYLKFLSNIRQYVTFINTESYFDLFSSKNGFRKNDFFRAVGIDNVHLSRMGVTRLGKHLKYLAHN